MSKAVRSREAVQRRHRKHYYRRRNHVFAYKAERQCADCPDGTIWPAHVLQFDHVRGEKIGNVSEMIGQGRPLEVIDAEMAKCDVVCANHHAMRTFDRMVEDKPTLWGDDFGR